MPYSGSLEKNKEINGEAATADPVPATIGVVAGGCEAALNELAERIREARAAPTPEVFENAGVVLGETSSVVTSATPFGQNIQSAPPIGLVQPTPTEVVRCGEAAMERLVGARSWADWVAVIKALDVGRTVAMREAGKNEPKGSRYQQAIAKWLRLHPAFGKMDPGDRSRLLKCLDNLKEIEAWREARILEKPRRTHKLNYPPYALRCWEAEKEEKKKQQQADSNGGGASSSSADSPLPTLKDIWPISTAEEKRAELQRETRSNLITLLAQTEFANHALAQRELADHALLQEINSTSMPKKNVVGDARVALTRIVREIASAPTPERRANAVELLIQKCTANNLHPSKLVVGHRDYAPPLTAQRAAKRKGARDL